jgi:undecaprenyl-diphosphatase
MEMLSRLHNYDRHLFAKVFRQGERHALIPLARAVSRSGDGYLHLLVPLALWQLRVPGFDDCIALLMLALGLERGLYWCLKNSLRRPRPQNAIPGLRSLVTASDQFSFPSGHSSGAFLLATALVAVYGGPVVAMYLWAGGVALSRVLLGVHFPGDILAGAFMGSSIALLSAHLLGVT